MFAILFYIFHDDGHVKQRSSAERIVEKRKNEDEEKAKG